MIRHMLMYFFLNDSSNNILKLGTHYAEHPVCSRCSQITYGGVPE